MRNAAAGTIAAMMFATPAQSIVPNDNFSPEDIRDPIDSVNGVGQFFRNDGFVCTGTLINPRTVLFAAHCVNSNPESDFADGNINSAFSFNGNALPGFIDWLNNGFASNPDLFVYNVSQIYYNAESLADPNAFGFLEADIALAALDDPAQNIPTWALLFSPLPTPDQITDETGTGYHVNITGYGRSGSGTTGSSFGIDWRRKSAENFLGSLTSFNDRNQFLFGAPFGDLPQVLYRLDFDDPDKTNPFDFNLYKDEPLANEGTTAGGDSGGPLILDAANNAITDEDIQIGVLSGGSRFFGAQVFSSYGTESFYQPLFLFHDYIAATNPYRYVSAKAGDGAWEDATHWQTDLDPAYRIIDADGNIVNGFPDTQELGRTGDGPQFGEVCFDPEGANPGDGCQDLGSGDLTPPARETGEPVQSGIGQANLPGAPNAIGVSDVAAGGDAAASSTVVEQVAVNAAPAGAETVDAPQAASAPGARAGMIMGSENQAHDNGAGMIDGGENIALANGNGVDFAIETPQNGVDLAENEAQADGGPEFAEEQPNAPGDPQPTPTLANGLVGATDFVPDNVDSDVDGILAGRRYFEVTLNQAGTTTLDSAVTIDRLNVGGAAGLMINGGGDLTMENDVNQTGGRVAVDGQLTSAGDYSLFAGVLSGNGTVTAPFLTNIAGAIAPGTMGTIGTLTIDGNAVLASGSSLLIDIGASGNSDLLQITGEASLGGTVGVNGVAGWDRNAVSYYRILTADGGYTGTFNAANTSAIITSELFYVGGNVDLRVAAQSYQTVVDSANPVQVSYAALMDRNRGNGAVQGLFDTLDFVPDAATIQAIFDSWAPTTEAATQSLARGVVGDLSNFHQNRISLADRSSSGGTVAVLGRPLQLASASLGGFGLSGSSAVLNDAAANSAADEVSSGAVNENMAVYLAGGFINGDGASMPLTNPVAGGGGDDEFDGFFIAGGMEFYFDEESFVGVSAYYSDVESSVALGHQAEGRAIMGSVYGRSKTFADLVLDARISIGTYNAQTQRNVALGAQAFNLTTDDDSLIYAAEVGLTKEFDLMNAIIAPGIRGRAAKVNFSNVAEAGGGPALTIVRPDYESVQGLAGVEFKTKSGKALQFRASAHYVHEFLDSNPNSFGANFVGGVGLLAPFALATPDRNWGEFGVGLRYNAGNISFDLNADTTAGRSDVQSQTYSGAVTFRF